jgi:hypothetical protein
LKSADFNILEDFEKEKLIGVPHSSLVTDGQLVAAFRAPARKHRAAVLALHARSETMRFGAFTVIWLERSLWHILPDSGNATRKEALPSRHTTEEVQKPI